MTAESTLTSKGQTTIPRGIRDRLHIKAGERMTFTMMPDRTVLLRVKNKSVMASAGACAERVGSPCRRRRCPADPMLGLDTNVPVRFLARDDEAAVHTPFRPSRR